MRKNLIIILISLLLMGCTQIRERQAYKRTSEFDRLLRQAKKFDWEMPSQEFYRIADKVKKVTYGENEFERKRDEARAERDYQKIIQVIYCAPIKVSIGKYDFSKRTLAFSNFSQRQYMALGVGMPIAFNRDIRFKPLRLNEKEAELIKRLAKSSTGYVVEGTVLFKVIGTGWGVSNYGMHRVVVLKAKIIDARIKVPNYGYLYMWFDTLW